MAIAPPNQSTKNFSRSYEWTKGKVPRPNSQQNAKSYQNLESWPASFMDSASSHIKLESLNQVVSNGRRNFLTHYRYGSGSGLGSLSCSRPSRSGCKGETGRLSYTGRRNSSSVGYTIRSSAISIRLLLDYAENGQNATAAKGFIFWTHCGLKATNSETSGTGRCKRKSHYKI